MAIRESGVFYDDSDAASFFADVMREDYLPGIIEALDNRNVLLNTMPMHDSKYEGKAWVREVHNGRSAGHSSIGPRGRIPLPDKQKYTKMKGVMRHHYGSIEVDDLMHEQGSGRATFATDVVDREIRGLTADMARQKNRMLHLDGSGRLAQCDGAVGASATVVCKLPQVPESPTTMVGMDPTYFLHAGMRVIVVDPAGPTIKAGASIASVDSATQITLDASITAADDDWICLQSDPANSSELISSSFKREPVGIAAHFSDGNPEYINAVDVSEHGMTAGRYQDVDATATANQFARATVLDNGGTLRPISEELLKSGMTKQHKGLGGKTDVMLSSYELQDAYGSLLVADRRFVNTKTFSGGWEGIDFEGKPWVRDRDCLPNRCYYVDWDALEYIKLREYSWQGRDGLVFRQVDGYDAWQAFVRGDWTTRTDVRNKLVLITDLQE